MLPSSASAATAAGVATTVTSLTASRATSATAAPTIAIAIATAAAGTPFTRAFRTRSPCLYRRNNSVNAVEVRLIIGIEICAAFDHCCGGALRSTVRR